MFCDLLLRDFLIQHKNLENPCFHPFLRRLPAKKSQVALHAFYPVFYA